jgi:TetR/AcrR family transcriptional regulator
MINPMRKKTAKPDPQRRILAAARQEFIAHGFAGAKMRPIAQKAKVNSALLHYYYQNKESLYAAALLDIVHSVWGSLEDEAHWVSHPKELPEMLRHLLRRYLDIVLASPEFPRFMLREVVEGGKHLPMILQTIQSRYGHLLQGILKQLQL